VRRKILGAMVAALFVAAVLFGINTMYASATTPQIGKIVQIIGPFDQCANGLCGHAYEGGGENVYLRVLAVNDQGDWFISDPINQGATTLLSPTPHMHWYQINNTTE